MVQVDGRHSLRVSVERAVQVDGRRLLSALAEQQNTLVECIVGGGVVAHSLGGFSCVGVHVCKQRVMVGCQELPMGCFIIELQSKTIIYVNNYYTTSISLYYCDHFLPLLVDEHAIFTH